MGSLPGHPERTFEGLGGAGELGADQAQGYEDRNPAEQNEPAADDSGDRPTDTASVQSSEPGASNPGKTNHPADQPENLCHKRNNPGDPTDGRRNGESVGLPANERPVLSPAWFCRNRRWTHFPDLGDGCLNWPRLWDFRDFAHNGRPPLRMRSCKGS